MDRSGVAGRTRDITLNAWRVPVTPGHVNGLVGKEPGARNAAEILQPIDPERVPGCAVRVPG
jgi:hypothetical protein